MALARAAERSTERPSSLRELASGVDALYLSARAALSRPFLDELASAKEVARSSGESLPIVVGGESFRVTAGGFNKYRYRLEHPHGLVGVTESEHLPSFWIQPRSEFIHAVGPEAVVEWYRARLAGACENEPSFLVSRIDLHADWQGWSLTGDDRHRFLCRATERDTYEQGEVLSGFVFGRRTTNSVLARIYDKTLEIADKGHEWWFDKWGDRFDPEAKVIRVEVQFGRDGLRPFRINRPEQALEARGDLWRYATGAWLTYRSPTEDATKSRWPLAPEWVDVQGATLMSEAVGLARVRDGIHRGSLRKLLPSLNGYVVALAAHVGTDTIEDTVSALPAYLREYQRRSGRSFSDRVQERRGAA